MSLTITNKIANFIHLTHSLNQQNILFSGLQFILALLLLIWQIVNKKLLGPVTFLSVFLNIFSKIFSLLAV